MPSQNSRVAIDYANVMSTAVGEANGITDGDLDVLSHYAATQIERIWNEYEAGEQRWMALPDNQELVSELNDFAATEGPKYRDFVLVGIGGSSLGAIATVQALAHPLRNVQSDDKRTGPRMFVLDNPDPEKVAATLETVDLSNTLVNVVTKSGQTAETMANFLVVKDALEQAVGKDNARQQIVATTDPKEGLLRQLADQEGYRTFPVPPGVDGRMTVLSAVGLLPAALCGIDIGGMLDGAASMRLASRNQNLRENPGALLASIAWLTATSKDKSILVMMPYADALYGIADWFRQLWAESLGKRFSLHDDEVFAGQTPIKALGAIDQHSQIQLYTEGPNDKLICLTGIGEYRSSVQLKSTPDSLSDLAYLQNAELGQLLDRERVATAWALTKAQRPNLTISLPTIDPAIIGELFFMHEFQTVFGGALFDVNPFGQPGVEAGKNATYALMGRDGYDELRSELETGSGDDQHRVQP